MPHKFMETDNDDGLQGVWYKQNGRRYCSWHFDAESSVLRANRGTVVHTATLEDQNQSLEELKAQLPQMALELANGKTLH
jgi:hypothetical protein